MGTAQNSVLVSSYSFNDAFLLELLLYSSSDVDVAHPTLVSFMVWSTNTDKYTYVKWSAPVSIIEADHNHIGQKDINSGQLHHHSLSQVFG